MMESELIYQRMNIGYTRLKTLIHISRSQIIQPDNSIASEYSLPSSLAHTKAAAFSVSEEILIDPDECYYYFVIIEYTKIS